MRGTPDMVGIIQTIYQQIQVLAALRVPYNNVEDGGTDPGDIIIHDTINLAYGGGERANIFDKAGTLEDAVSAWDPSDELLIFSF